MKKYLILLCLIFSSYSYTQVKPIKETVIKKDDQKLKITGFGKLQLGMSVSDLDELKEAKEMTSYIDYVMKVYRKIDNKTVYEQIFDSTKVQRSFASPNNKVRIFTVPKIKITDNIALILVELKFYEDKLYDILCNTNTDVDEALTFKYGAPKIEKKVEEKKFTYTNTGNTVTKIENTYTSTWNTNDTNIDCHSYIRNLFDNEGKESYISFIKLNNMSIVDNVYVFEKKYFVAEKIKKEALKKAKLSGF